MSLQIEFDGVDEFNFLSDEEGDDYQFQNQFVESSPYLHGGDAVQDDYNSIMSFANRWKGWALIASPPKIGSTARSHFGLSTLNQLWLEHETRMKESATKVSEFANQWKSVLLKYNQKLSKLEEEKSAAQSVSDVVPFLPAYVDLRGLHSEDQILIGIWRQLSLSNVQNLANLHQTLIGFLSQTSKITCLVLDHVSKLAAINIARLLNSISDLIGIVVIGEIIIDPSRLLSDQYDNKDSNIGNEFTSELSVFCSVLKLPWDLATEKENERVLVSATTLTNRATRALVSSMMGFSVESLFPGVTTPTQSLKSQSGFFDAQLARDDINRSKVSSDREYSHLPPEQKSNVLEIVEIIAELSDGIPGIVSSLIHLELPVLRQLQKHRLTAKPVRTRLLSTSKYVSAGRVCAAVARLYLAMIEIVFSAENDRINLLSLLYFSCPQLLEQNKGDFTLISSKERVSFPMCLNDLQSQGVSDAFLTSLATKGFLIFIPAIEAYVMPSTLSYVLLNSLALDENKESQLKSTIFGQLCTNVANYCSHTSEQKWVQHLPDLKVTPICMLQQHIATRQLETCLPQLTAVLSIIIQNQQSLVPIPQKDIVQSLFLLISAGSTVLQDWCSVGERLQLFHLFSVQIHSWTGDDIRRALLSVSQVLDPQSTGYFTVQLLVLNIVAVLQDTVFEWWWLSGAAIFQPKHNSAQIRQLQAQEWRSMAMSVVGLLDRFLAISAQYLADAPTSQWTASSSTRTTTSVYLQSQQLLYAAKHRCFVEIAMSLDALDRLETDDIASLVDDYAVQLRSLSAQTMATLDNIDLSGIDIEDEIVLLEDERESDGNANLATPNKDRSKLLDHLPVAQKLLLSLKKSLKLRYEDLLAVATDLSSLSGPDASFSDTNTGSAPVTPNTKKLSPQKQRIASRSKREEAVKHSKNMQLFQLTSEDMEKVMLIDIACSFPTLYEMMSGFLLQILLRRYPNNQLKAAAIAETSVEGLQFPSVASNLVLRGRLLFSHSLVRQFSTNYVVHPSSLSVSSVSTIDNPLLLGYSGGICDTAEDHLLWTAYVQRLSDEQEGLSPTPWHNIASMMYSHPIVTKAEEESISVIQELMKLMAQYMRKVHQEYEKLFQMVDFAFFDSNVENKEDESAADNASSDYKDRVALSNISSIYIANAGIIYSDLIACMTQFGFLTILPEDGMDAPRKDDANEEEDINKRVQENDERLAMIMDAKDICDDALQICSRIMALYSLREQTPRLVVGFAYFLLYELSVFPLKCQALLSSPSSSERYLGAVHHRSIAAMTATEAIARLEQRRTEGQLWNVAFHYQYLAFRILKMLSLPRLHQMSLFTVSLRGLNDYHGYYQYQVEIQRILEPGRGGSSSNTTNITTLHLPEELLETVHMMTKAIQQATQYEYHVARRQLDQEILSHYALTTTVAIATAANSANDSTAMTTITNHAQSKTTADGTTKDFSSSVDRVLQINSQSEKVGLSSEEHQLQVSIYDIQFRLQQLAGHQLLLLYCARIYDSLVGGQSVMAPPLISTNISLPFLHPQQHAQSVPTGNYEVSSTGFARAMDLYKHIMQQYRDISNLLYAKELWEDFVPKNLKKNLKKNSRKVQEKEQKSMTLWGHIVESVYPHPFDPFFKHPEEKKQEDAIRRSKEEKSKQQQQQLQKKNKTVAKDTPSSRRKVVGGTSSNTHPQSRAQLLSTMRMASPERHTKEVTTDSTMRTDTPTNAHAENASTIPTSPINPGAPAVVATTNHSAIMDSPPPFDTSVDMGPSKSAREEKERRQEEEEEGEEEEEEDVQNVAANEDTLGFPRARQILRLREHYTSLALRFADVLYLLGEAIYHDGLARYKLAPQLSDEISDMVFEQYVAAISAARQLYEQELTPRQYCPISLILLRQMAQHQILQNQLDKAIKTFEEMLKLFLETKFTSLLVLAEIYTEYGDALILKKEYFHGSLMYQMAIDHYRDYDADRPTLPSEIANHTESIPEEQKQQPQHSQEERREKRFALSIKHEGLELKEGSSFSSDTHVSFEKRMDDTNVDDNRQQKKKKHANTRSALLLDYVWSLYIPDHLQEARVTEEFLKERLALNLIAKSKALFPTEDYEQAQELAEQAQHIMALLMSSTTKIVDEEAVKQEKRQLRSQKMENSRKKQTDTTSDNIDDDDDDDEKKEEEEKEGTKHEEEDEVNAYTTAQPPLNRAEREAKEMEAQDQQLRRLIVCSPIAVDIYLLLALIHFQYDEYDDAERYFQKAETSLYELGEEESLTMIKVYHNRGILLHSKGEKEDAKLFFEQALMLLFRRHSNAFYQIASTLEALEDVYEEMKLTGDLEMMRKYHQELETRLTSFEHMREERKKDLQRLISGLQAFEQEKLWQRQRWNEEEAAYHGFDDDGNVALSDHEDEENVDREGNRADDPSSSDDEERDDTDRDQKRRSRREVSGSNTYDHDDNASVSSSSDLDMSSGDEDIDLEHIDWEDPNLTAERKAHLQRRLRRHRRQQKQQQRVLQRQRRQAKAEAMYRHRQRQQQQQNIASTSSLNKLHGSTSFAKMAQSTNNSPDKYYGAPSNAQSPQNPNNDLSPSPSPSSSTMLSWQEYIGQKRLHAVAGVGVDRMTVGMLRRAFHVLQNAQQQRQQQEQHLQLQQPPQDGGHTSSALRKHHLAATLVSSTSLSHVPGVVVDSHNNGNSSNYNMMNSHNSNDYSSKQNWQQLLRTQQHSLYFGTEASANLDYEDYGDDYNHEQPSTSSKMTNTVRKTVEENKKVKKGTQGTAGNDIGSSNSSVTTGEISGKEDSIETEELPELPSGNCVVS